MVEVIICLEFLFWGVADIANCGETKDGVRVRVCMCLVVDFKINLQTNK